MEPKSVKCPQCGGEVMYVGDVKQIFCQYCGSKLGIDRDTAILEKTIQVQVAELENKKRSLELDLERKEQDAKRNKREKSWWYQELTGMWETVKDALGALAILAFIILLFYCMFKYFIPFMKANR